jgi:Ca-activated chloride channel family protein
MAQQLKSIFLFFLVFSIFLFNPACVNRKIATPKEPDKPREEKDKPVSKKSAYDVKAAYVEKKKKSEIRRVSKKAKISHSPQARERAIMAFEHITPMASRALCKSKSFAGAGYMVEAECLPGPAFNTEEYSRIYENRFVKVANKPLSTFSIDVDAASYSNMRRFLMQNALPPKDAIRIEEMINYFRYDYPQPENGHPFSITTELGACPWNKKHKLVHIGLQGIKVETKNLPASNLVFLLDVSGSMNSPNKLPLLKTAFKMLVKNLRKEDKVSIVVYAGAAGLVLPPTQGTDKNRIIQALESLQAGGSTAGGAGIRLAYETAKKNYLRNGNNRVVLATDGDFNVGVSSEGNLVRLIEEKRKQGIFLTVLGFGMGNYKDSKMEKLADKGNGNYAYIDNVMEAKKVLVEEMGGTLLTIAKDVKLQIEFNPAKIQAYRLIGYENRVLADEDFNDDKKDAGELGVGHSVTALYEIIPVGVKAGLRDVDTLKYQNQDNKTKPMHKDEVLTVKFRYKDPKGSKSKLLQEVVKAGETSAVSDNYTFSAAVAGFGMLLRDSQHKGELKYKRVLDMAKTAKGKDEHGYRAEFISLVQRAQVLSEALN